MAAAIDLRMQHLAADGVPASAIIDHMAATLFDLHTIWESTSDDQLGDLCAQYPGFYRFAMIMEEAAEAERRKPTRPYDDLPLLSDPLKERLTLLLGNAADLERDYRSSIDNQVEPDRSRKLTDLARRLRTWLDALASFKAELGADDIPQKTRDMIVPGLDRMAGRIADLESRANAPVGLTEEQVKIAEAIDKAVDRLLRAGKSQTTIFGSMQNHMRGFKVLLDADVVQQAADRFPGFRHFAKILERIAKGIKNGEIRVPR